MRTAISAALAISAASSIAVLSACGGSSSGGQQSTAEASSAVSATSSAGTSATSACNALTPAQVQAVLGRAATGVPTQSSASGGGAYQLDACVWGQVTEGAVLSLQVFTPGAVKDPLGLLMSAAGTSSTPVPSLPAGKYYSTIGLMPGGGGVGATVTWQPAGRQAALSLATSSPGPDTQQQLTTAAQQANQAMQ